MTRKLVGYCARALPLAAWLGFILLIWWIAAIADG